MAIPGSGKPKTWMKAVMAIAGLYSLLWAGYLVINPLGIFAGLGLAPPNYVALPQAIGFAIGVMGLGYLVAASNPLRHWGIVLVGLASKLFGATGSWLAVQRGEMPPDSVWMIVVNDLIWCVPFALILQAAYQHSLQHRRTLSPDIVRMALRRKTNQGVTLDEMSALSPVLIVFLRHAGCTFCREALADLAARRKEIEAQGARLTLVHMGTDEQGGRFFKKYGLENVARVSDSDRALYRAFGLPRGSFGDLFGPKVWWRGFQAAILGRHGVGLLAGDGFQMPGVFLIFHGEVIRSYRHLSAADRPDYLALVTGREYASPEFSS
jgi:peroxiredoxin